MRSAFIKTLSLLAKDDKGVLLLTGDLGFKIFDDFRENHPEQFFNMGVAEANMVSVAAGLALEGKKPFIYSIASFLTMRPYEQIRNDICFHQARVVIVAAGGGFSYGPNGPSHHALTDVALMRSLPEMTVFTPADLHETSWAVKTAHAQKGPSYIRLSRASELCVHSRSLNDDHPKKGVVLCDGEDIAILVSGFILPNALRAKEELIKLGYSVRLISFPLIKPLSEHCILEAFQQCSWVFTVEEHSLIGGFSSAVTDLALKRNLALDKLCPIAATDVTYHETGSHQYLQQKAGLDSEGILSRMLTFIKEKSYADRP